METNFCIQSCIFSVEECRNIITQFGVGEVTAAQVARVLGMMARTHSGLTDGISLQVSKWAVMLHDVLWSHLNSLHC